MQKDRGPWRSGLALLVALVLLSVLWSQTGLREEELLNTDLYIWGASLSEKPGTCSQYSSLLQYHQALSPPSQLFIQSPGSCIQPGH